MNTIDQFRTTFFQECDELLAALEPLLSKLDCEHDREESLNAAFRAVHSIKGGSAMFGFRRLISFAHAFESVLEIIRSQGRPATGDVIEKLLRSADMMTDLAQAAKRDIELPEGHEASALEDLALISGSDRIATTFLDPAPIIDDQGAGGTPHLYQIVFVPGADLLRRGMEPLALIRSLQELGALTVSAETSGLPDVVALDPGAIYLKWTFELVTSSSVADIQKRFEFVADGALIEITRMGLDSTAGSPSSFGTSAGASSGAGHVVHFDRRVSSIRVDLDRVERLVDLIGEITIAQSMVLQFLDKAAIDTDPLLFRALGQLQQLTRGLQDGVMAIRAQPIRSVFARIPRVAREVAQVTGRRVQIDMTGEETEIDKTIVEQLSDPLMHIVRNSIDHGIEPASDRLKAGKPEAGLLKLSAAQRGGRIIIEVSDDGRGIDRAAVLQKAIERNIVSADAALSDNAIDQLIFQPGLSTSKVVSGISGRGVGMDVVKRNIQAIGGRISIRSDKGIGTTTIITLPLTLAVLDGMLVRAGSESYHIPLNNVAECFVTSRGSLEYLPGTGEIVAIRGRRIPAIHLARKFGLPHVAETDVLQVVVVETEDGGSIGLIVDEILGNQQIVIKSIKGACGELKGIAGATILGDGNIALILDVTQIALMYRTPDPRSRSSLFASSRPETFAA